MIEALILGLALAAGGALAATVVEKHSNNIRRGRAYKRLQDDPRVFHGAKILELQSFGRDTPIMGECEIVTFGFGVLEVADFDTGKVATFTGREFEQLIPIFKIGGTPEK